MKDNINLYVAFQWLFSFHLDRIPRKRRTMSQLGELVMSNITEELLAEIYDFKISGYWPNEHQSNDSEEVDS